MDGARVLLPGEDPWPLRAEVTDDSVFTRGGEMTVVCTSTADKKCFDRWLRANAACKGVWEVEPSVDRPRSIETPQPSVRHDMLGKGVRDRWRGSASATGGPEEPRNRFLTRSTTVGSSASADRSLEDTSTPNKSSSSSPDDCSGEPRAGSSTEEAPASCSNSSGPSA